LQKVKFASKCAETSPLGLFLTPSCLPYDLAISLKRMFLLYVVFDPLACH
jgi:hypothetical protein